MKPKTLKIILAAVTIVSLALAIYCLVVSIKGTGSSWALPAALGLSALGNFINILKSATIIQYTIKGRYMSR